jgi:hypothetical protein
MSQKKDPRHIVTTVGFSNWIEGPIENDDGTEIDIEVNVTYIPRMGNQHYFSVKHGCWFPGDQPEIEVISVDFIPGSKLDDMSLWTRIEAQVRKNLMEDDSQLWEHFADHMENNADSRDDSHAMRNALNELLHNRKNLFHPEDEKMVRQALGQ